MSKRPLRDHHIHLDRVGTYDDRFFAHQGGIGEYDGAPLKVKQVAMGVLHTGLAYTEKSLTARMERAIQAKIRAGEVLVNAIVDCSPDIDDIAFKIALDLREKYRDKIEINVGVYPIFGFKTWGSDRQLLFNKLCSRAQFIMGLPERDERNGHERVGFDGHMAYIVEASIQHNLPLQVHVDQTNTPGENGTEKLTDCVHWLHRTTPADKRPKVWAVHAVSTSCYEEERFCALARRMAENNIGLIVCPHAALSMRQIRVINSPIHNSIARIREFALAGVEIVMGTDNCGDLLMPKPKSVLLTREEDTLASSARFYHQAVIDKWLCGQRLTQTDLAIIRRSVDGDEEAFRSFLK